jgi:hypothetical protein
MQTQQSDASCMSSNIEKNNEDNKKRAMDVCSDSGSDKKKVRYEVYRMGPAWQAFNAQIHHDHRYGVVYKWAVGFNGFGTWKRLYSVYCLVPT